MDIIYLLAPKLKLLVCRLYRNPLVFLGIGQRYFLLIARAVYTSGKGRMNAVASFFPLQVVKTQAPDGKTVAFGTNEQDAASSIALHLSAQQVVDHEWGHKVDGKVHLQAI